MSTDRVLVALSTFAQYDASPLDRLRASGVPYTLHGSGARITAAELAAAGRDATVVIAGVEPYTGAVLDTLPLLRCISRCGAGVDNVDLAEARARGISVLNTPGVPGRAVAELALAMMLALRRNLIRQSALMRARQWTRLESHLLAGAHVGIVGLGQIGRRVAMLARAFDADVLAVDPKADASWAVAHGVRLTTFDDLLASADIVSLHAARLPSSPLALDAAAIGRMRPGALLVNLARGGMVDEAALYDALVAGHLGGAALDVYAEEPYRGPLCDLDSVILTPHSATLAVETRVEMENECVDKALRFILGELAEHERVA
jgi:D-3-phosphoglycerate dehydrogenase / 2-oxoglutarate reductase